ncbi:MAG: hypothetical protein KBA92_06890 [Anaerolineaceae bacterium]|nr:hypothetical protein [Anaerolineaceae bacterium]
MNKNRQVTAPPSRSSKTHPIRRAGARKDELRGAAPRMGFVIARHEANCLPA